MPSREAYEGFPESVGLNLEMSNSNSLIPIFAFLHNVLIFFFFTESQSRLIVLLREIHKYSKLNESLKIHIFVCF